MPGIIIDRVNSEFIRVIVPPAPISDKKKSPKIVFILDGSGSMSGIRMSRALKVLNALFEDVGELDLIVFDNCHRIYENVSSVPDGAIRFGGTSFFGPLKHIQEHLYPPGTVVFFSTDGENMYDDQVRVEKLLLQRPVTEKMQVNVLGITDDSDTRSLFKISEWGQVPGEYYFLGNDKSVPDVIESLRSHISSYDINVLGQNIRLKRQSQTLFIANTSFDCPQAPLEANMALQHFLLEKAIKNEDYDAMGDLCRKMRSCLELNPGIRKQMGRDEYKAMMAQIYESNSILRELQGVVANRQMTNAVMSELFRNARSSRNQKFNRITDKRAQSNIEIFAEQDLLLEQKAKEMTEYFKDHPIPEELNETCMLSMSTAQELLEAGDCLGVGIRIRPNSVTLVQPELIEVTNVSTSFLACKDFLEQASQRGYAIYTKPDGLITDSSREGVTGVLPLYLNEKHWEVASLLVRRMAGFAVDGDPSSGSNKINFWLYFCVYDFLATVETEYAKKIRTDILQCIRSLYKRCPDVIPTPQQFMSNPSDRMKDRVYNIDRWLKVLQVLEITPDQEEELFRLYLVEESVRREMAVDYYNVVPEPDYPSFYQEEKGIIISDLLNPNDQPSIDDYQSMIDDVVTRAKIEIPVVKHRITGDLVTDWYIVKQVTDNLHSCEAYCSKYVDYIANRPTEEQLVDYFKQQLRANFVRFISSRLADARSFLREVAVEKLESSKDLSDEEFARLASLGCYIGTGSIVTFAYKANNDEKIRMLVTGYYKGQKVVNDIDLYVSYHHYPDTMGDPEYIKNLWIPTRRRTYKLGWIDALRRLNIEGYDVKRDFSY